MLLLLVHECGHIGAALYFHWNIGCIKVYPFGAITKFQEHLNKPIWEEWLIALAGPILQMIFYCLFQHWLYLKEYHYAILCFNLLPIYPLDGFKLVSLGYQRIFSYWSSTYFEFFLSMITILVLCFTADISLVFLLILGTLIIDVIENFKDRKIRFQKFLLERFLYPMSFKRRKTIKDGKVTKMCRDVKHVFYKNGYYFTEEQYLQKMFDFKGKA